MPASPLTFRFSDDGAVPNNPLPMLVYKAAVDLAGAREPEAAIEKVFDSNGWGHGRWRDGIYPFTHYHSMIHEVLGIARGTARVRFGGPRGEALDLAPGDIAVLPAGTGHQRLSGSADLVVIGGYPPHGTYDLCRGDNPNDHAKALKTIPAVPAPGSDPVHGKSGPLLAAFGGLARTLFSEYRKLRSALGLSHYTEAEFLAILAAAGFLAERHYPNIEHNQQRMTFVAQRA